MRNKKGQFIKGAKPWNAGTKGKMTSWNKGLNISGHSGKKHTEEYKIMMRKRFLGIPVIQTRNENHPNWKGDQAGYRSIHIWVQLRLGKANHCENNVEHLSTRYHWANISGEYKRDLSDWKQLCPSCNKRDGVKIAERFTQKEGLIT